MKRRKRSSSALDDEHTSPPSSKTAAKMVPEIVTPTFSVIKSGGRKRHAKEDDGSEEDIRDETVARTHAYYEQLERKLHAAFLSNRPPALRSAFLDTDALPDTFTVRVDAVELKSDPLPPPPRILRTPARFLNGAVSGGSGSKKASANVVTRLPADLSTLLPMRLGILNVMALGRIVAQPGYFTERYLYPVGFRSEREYVSGLDPACKTVYRSEIRDGPSGPVFYVTAADDAANPVVAESPSKCWSEVIRRINAERIARQHKPVYTAISGPEYFGISKPRIAALFEQLDGAERCVGYQFRFFNPLTKRLLDDDGPVPVVVASDVGARRPSTPSSSRTRTRTRSDSNGAAPSRMRDPRTSKRVKKSTPRSLALSEPAPAVLDAACEQCGGERGDLLTCRVCAASYHVRCVELSRRPAADDPRWTCASCADAAVRASKKKKAGSSKKPVARKRAPKTAARARPTPVAVRKTVKHAK